MIINEEAGVWKNDAWYSNSLSFEYKPMYQYGQHSHGQYGNDVSNWHNEHNSVEEDWESVVEQEMSEFCCPKDTSDITITVTGGDDKKNNKEKTEEEQDAQIDKYIEKYPTLFAPSFKAKRLAKLKERANVLKTMASAVTITSTPLALPAAIEQAKNEADTSNNVIPMHDPNSVFHKKD